MMESGLFGLAVVAGLTGAIWLLSLVTRDVSKIDIFWGPGFAILAWIYYLQGNDETLRQLMVPSLVTLWGLRLGAYIYWRGRGQREDYRYAEMRERWGPRFPLVSLAIVFWLQAVLMWVIAIPLLLVQHAAQPSLFGLRDSIGVGLFALGFFFETVGDLQMSRFKADPANRGKVLDTGLWRYTRHPNYFGDAALWWGIWILTSAAEGAAWTIASPLLMTFLLLKVSGVSLLEQGLEKTKPAYREYVRRTSAFIPWPPKRR
jgi:steroid 5-alpha reductase family enzyme